jgi:hypothetical protein
LEKEARVRRWLSLRTKSALLLRNFATELRRLQSSCVLLDPDVILSDETRKSSRTTRIGGHSGRVRRRRTSRTACIGFFDASQGYHQRRCISNSAPTLESIAPQHRWAPWQRTVATHPPTPRQQCRDESRACLPRKYAGTQPLCWPRHSAHPCS